ncbi:heat shock 70 kDa protein 12A-like [Ostrea edulis]|uniref:heat shock 70 kDa protein 12A-like n=1 Tax=Ostrea edulis TaxID=37623 RepID=UPI0024AEA105|nr:heat shock 70 kDa protein 12A-like [Ostrea edulis]
MSEERKSSSSRLLVAAIDFGTTYSGYAYSFKSNWAKVLMNKWEGGQLASYKAPTALLLNPDKTLNSFGYEAEKTYSDIATDKDEEGRTCKEYYYFYRFKMILKTTMTQRVHRKSMCKDENEREMEAMPIFTHCIKYLKDHLLGVLSNSTLGGKVEVKDIDFVLTVPAIWDDTAKMFMREAAVKAGIPDHQLQIALEPEAASIYCQLMHFDAAKTEKALGNWTRGPGIKYMVIDIGGGTADITVHQLQDNGTLAELVPASGGKWGGTRVDDAYRNFLKDIFGDGVLKTFKDDLDYIVDYVEFWQGFEVKKREQITAKETDKVHLRIPLALTEIVKEKTELTGVADTIMNALIKKSKHNSNGIYSSGGKLVLPIDFYKNLFNPPIEELVMHLSKMFKNDLESDVDVILMVGGFSECDLVINKLERHFGNKRLVVPYEAGLAVLKGAVFFGHHKDLISRRVARYTYGIQTWPKFDKSIHSPQKKQLINREERCKDVFLKFVSIGEPIEPGFKKSFFFRTLRQGDKLLECGVFITNQKDPKYVDDKECVKIGTLTVPLMNSELWANTEIEESIIFGETEIRVTAYNTNTGQKHEVTFDLLSPNLNMPNSSS